MSQVFADYAVRASSCVHRATPRRRLQLVIAFVHSGISNHGTPRRATAAAEPDLNVPDGRAGVQREPADEEAGRPGACSGAVARRAPCDRISPSRASRCGATIQQFTRVAAEGDAEFCLKLALYLRDDLNIRSTANFLVVRCPVPRRAVACAALTHDTHAGCRRPYMQACAARAPQCRPFLGAYVPRIVRLPSDWLAIADMYTQVTNEPLPSALRKALAATFGKFSEYQVGKYNNQRAMARLAKKNGGASSKKHTLKRLVRLLHVSEPRATVMKLLGKKWVHALGQAAAAVPQPRCHSRVDSHRAGLPLLRVAGTQRPPATSWPSACLAGSTRSSSVSA